MKAVNLSLALTLSSVAAACEEMVVPGRMGIQETNERVAKILWVGFIVLVVISWAVHSGRRVPRTIPWFPLVLTILAIVHPALLTGGTADGDCAGTMATESKVYAVVAICCVVTQVCFAFFRAKPLA